MKVLIGIGRGILYGICAAIGLFILVGFGTCCGKCTWGCNDINTALDNIVFFGMVIGFIIGFIIGVIEGIIEQLEYNKTNAELRQQEADKLEKEYMKKRQQYATEFKKRANDVVKRCNSNKNDGDKIILQPDYKGISLQGDLWLALNDASIPLQKPENIVSEFSAKKGGY